MHQEYQDNKENRHINNWETYIRERFTQSNPGPDRTVMELQQIVTQKKTPGYNNITEHNSAQHTTYRKLSDT